MSELLHPIKFLFIQILAELDEAVLDKKKPPHIIADLICLKMEIRVLVSEHLDEFTYKTMSHIDRDMEWVHQIPLYLYIFNVFNTML